MRTPDDARKLLTNAGIECRHFQVARPPSPDVGSTGVTTVAADFLTSVRFIANCDVTSNASVTAAVFPSADSRRAFQGRAEAAAVMAGCDYHPTDEALSNVLFYGLTQDLPDRLAAVGGEPVSEPCQLPFPAALLPGGE